ncbi:MAG: hypothetical protein AAF849_00550 [Bacteroidota bacterium]
MKMNKLYNPQDQLGYLIDGIAKRLSTYTLRSNANPYHIQQQRDLLFKLQQIQQQVSSLQLWSIWQDIESIMHSSLKKDAEIGAFHIWIRTNHHNPFPNTCLIDKYWYL